MERVKNILKPKPNPQQLLRDWQRRLRQECRNIERQIRDIQREEKSVQKAIKEAAKRNDMGSAKVNGMFKVLLIPWPQELNLIPAKCFELKKLSATHFS
ncbi:UNVERIFIED_CONTAM: Vacuolar protein sorting-associated protein [Sesamum radiatum]|uniref:Vacuolar protein sorting-associated protein n=1 Tax=Sesamum radiatum TaxID=300843 RepID=A0AAW2W9Y4_SESRA